MTETTEQENEKVVMFSDDSLDFMFAQAHLKKLLNSGVISYKVYALAEMKCRERLSAA
jgi:uncharacterized protein YqgQ